ncbi:MAG TPA: sugar phosphate isomerase/epimerase [Flavihumibacter sp.]|nr:sugar phosphate isomerase/epimerase [Flavihumibacter sp.]HQD09643.1 sugar phosphate isomerase/epimerase [Flavihumibacter sp.]
MMKKIVVFVCACLLVHALCAQIQPGVVSYSFRDAFAKDVPGTLDAIKGMGISDIEFSSLFGKTAAELKALLDERGLTCSSYGVSYDDLTKKTDEVGQAAKTLGASYVRVAWIPHDSTGFTEATTLKAANDFNAAGKILKDQYGLLFCYHNHGYEFADWGKGTYFDLLAAKTNPRYVGFEMDILWVYFPGKDPVELLKKYPKRFYLMHVKDLKPGVARSPTGGTSGNNNVPVGQGQLDMVAILQTAQKIGIKKYYIEDESDRSFEQVPVSIAFIKSIK